MDEKPPAVCKIFSSYIVYIESAEVNVYRSSLFFCFSSIAFLESSYEDI